MSTIVIIGAGHAGVEVASRLRALGSSDRIVLFSQEEDKPYYRPHLSKGLLGKELAEDRIWLKSEAFYRDTGIELRLGTPVQGIDIASRTCVADDVELPFDKLVMATGGRPRRLPLPPGLEPFVHYLRSVGDCRSLQSVLGEVRRIAVVGGGFIGLEFAAIARKFGVSVRVLEIGPRILARAVIEPVSDAVRALHRDNGVEISEGVGIADLSAGSSSRVCVSLANGECFDVDAVLVGIGMEPNVELAREAGLKVSSGIEIDDRGRTSAPDIWACGDCAAVFRNGGPTRIESVQSAIDQASAVARDIMGIAVPSTPPPAFWSDQFTFKIQIAGLPCDHDRIIERRDHGRSFWAFAGDRLVNVYAINEPAAFMLGRAGLSGGMIIRPDLIENHALDLKDIRKQAQGAGRYPLLEKV